jgi:hypothetical protein
VGFKKWRKKLSKVFKVVAPLASGFIPGGNIVSKILTAKQRVDKVRSIVRGAGGTASLIGAKRDSPSSLPTEEGVARLADQVEGKRMRRRRPGGLERLGIRKRFVGIGGPYKKAKALVSTRRRSSRPGQRGRKTGGKKRLSPLQRKYFGKRRPR